MPWRGCRHTRAVTTVMSLRVVAATRGPGQNMLLPVEPCVSWCLHSGWNSLKATGPPQLLKINPTRPPAACLPAAAEWASVGSLQASQSRKHTQLTRPGLVCRPRSPHRQRVGARCGSEPCPAPHGRTRTARGTQKHARSHTCKPGTTRTTALRGHRSHEHTQTWASAGT